MKLANLVFSFTLMTAIGSQSSIIYAAEVRNGGRAEGDRNAPTPLLQYTLQKAPEQSIAEGGADRLHERGLAADGSDHLKQNRMAEGGSDRLLENRVADNGNVNVYRAVPGFCMACR
ncbi:hypothetical protein JRG42_24955 [Pseudomonas granadensis]|uniref:Phage infection protein n=1 Tax=Pseudomonas granadensis TaxID=1421430 RepID=A0ABX7GNV4_9PSED|nr:hypothetical protein [Pseudomonas granadensis]MBN6776481.1 hypothetical protein [Pseudomonas granadensis]MBN6807602.1 hypothetical protein [Pseudomonas granadensis]MBN6834464.1 hypothetical protein [Pseudomonas granadensis]MBN6841938.1 hypothetical protein [Pseudomonas granadensis]MBN6870510.1 hypothetical protein [Pseudomonas granadensis]